MLLFAYFLPQIFGRCDPDRCPDMGPAMSCGLVISEGRDNNYKCGYLTTGIDKYPAMERKCKVGCYDVTFRF